MSENYQFFIRCLHQPLALCCAAFLCDLCLLSFGCTQTSLKNTAFLLTLLVCSFYDLRFQRIPNTAVLVMIISRFLFSNPSSGFLQFLQGILRSAAISLCLSIPVFAAAFLFRFLSGRKGLGGGDIKLVFASGLYLGLSKGLWMLLLSCIFVLLYFIVKKTKKSKVFAFGPFLSLSAGILLFL